MSFRSLTESERCSITAALLEKAESDEKIANQIQDSDLPTEARDRLCKQFHSQVTEGRRIAEMVEEAIHIEIHVSGV